MSWEEKERRAVLYRFSGYQLPMIQLDETGPAYVILPPHPYFTHPQPEFWTRGAYTEYPTGSSATIKQNNALPTENDSALVPILPSE